MREIMAGKELRDSQKVINLLYQIPTQPNQECDAAAASLTNEVAHVAAAGVEDIRRQLTITIDPSGCQDVDDALTLSELPTGGFLVGVHIADVGRFVKQGDVIDSNARRRMTSFYAATDEVYHMLPSRLSADICSLLQGSDRHVLSVYLETDRQLNITETTSRSPICRSLIRNDRQMTYEEAQQFIDEAGYQRLRWKEGDVESMVVHLHRIAQCRRIARLREARFYVSEPDDPFSLAYTEAHQLIEALMIETNFTVAKFLFARFPESVPVCRQKSPDNDDVKKWAGRHEAPLQVSLFFQQFDMLSSYINRDTRLDESSKPMVISLLQSTVNDMKAAVERRDLRKAVSLIAHESQHPLHLLAINNWIQIQVCAFFVLRFSNVDISFVVLFLHKPA